MTLDFGKYKGTHITDVPNKYLGWLTKWEVGVYCSCEGEDCDDNCDSRPAKVRRVDKKGCSRECWMDGERIPCDSDCDSCSAIRFLATKPDIVEAAREEAMKRRLCCSCWKVMPSIGYSRSNGKAHDDWDTRFLHKKCWRELMED